MMRRALALAVGCALAGAAELAGQAGVVNEFANRTSGSVVVTSELYDASGIEDRRPNSTWRVQASPSFRLFGATSVGVDLLLSNEGSEFRQRLPQLGFQPRFSWGTLYLIDFSRDYGAYTVQGLRLRGGGVDFGRGGIRASAQGGVSLTALPATPDGPTYKRTMFAGAVGIGAPERKSLDLTLVHAWDALQENDVPFIDTLGLDTLPADLRPQAYNRPQSGTTAALAGTLGLFRESLKLKGEVAVGLLTRDRTSPLVNTDSISGGGAADALGDVRFSSNGDLAWNVDAQYRHRRFGLRGGFEQVGAGYASLGVAYLINDRQSWNLGGDVRVLGDRLQLQGRVQRQRDNLQDHKRFTTSRAVYQAAATGRISRATVAVTAVHNTAGNDATNDTLLVDNRATVLNGQLSIPVRLAGRDMATSFGYSWQQNEDANPIREIPPITVNTWNVGLSVPIGPVTVTPSVNGVSSSGGGSASEKNVVAGIRASARFAQGKGNVSAGYNRTFVAAREVTGATVTFGWALPYEVRLSVNGRLQDYGAFGARPAFREAYLTTSLARSF